MCVWAWVRGWAWVCARTYACVGMGLCVGMGAYVGMGAWVGMGACVGMGVCAYAVVLTFSPAQIARCAWHRDTNKNAYMQTKKKIGYKGQAHLSARVL